MGGEKTQDKTIKKQKSETVDGEALVAFIEQCYRLYEQKMYRAAYCILRDSAWAEDAVQDAFLKLMKGQVYFADAGSDDCKKYIITVIRHSAIDIYNKKKRERELFCFCNQTLSGERVCAPESGGKIDVQEIMSVLSPRYYEVVDCLAVKNLSVKETAGKLGISEANVRKRFERAKKMLRRAK